MATVVIPFITGELGLTFRDAIELCSAHKKKKRMARKTWLQHRRQFYIPLAESARELNEHLYHLKILYGIPGDKDCLSEDFSEIFMLSRVTIPDLEKVKPHVIRKTKLDDVADLRVRMCPLSR